MVKLLSREESMENLKDNLSYFLCEYEKGVKASIIKNICELVSSENKDIKKFNSNDYSIEACDKYEWHDSNNNGLYFNMKLYYQEKKDGRVDLILDGTYVGDYDTGYDFGVQLKKGKISIPFNYRHKDMGFLSYLFGWK